MKFHQNPLNSFRDETGILTRKMGIHFAYFVPRKQNYGSDDERSREVYVSLWYRPPCLLDACLKFNWVLRTASRRTFFIILHILRNPPSRILRASANHKYLLRIFLTNDTQHARKVWRRVVWHKFLNISEERPVSSSRLFGLLSDHLEALRSSETSVNFNQYTASDPKR